MDTNFVGENLRPGQLGHFFVILFFVSALFSAYSYFRAAKTEGDVKLSTSWLQLGRTGFIIHAASVIGTFLALYYIIANHLFEYHYAWEHSSRSLPMKYLLSSFWEGQQGSFMLWAFWHGILGLFVMKTSKVMESRVMAIIALVQVALATMLLGFHFGDAVKVGSTPFMLLRDAMQDAPIFKQANYLSFIQDGNGLNPLLQNYWMAIHPPVLFLGFGATLIPFAYTIAALWKGEYQTWIKEARVWTLFAGASLGLGIMMGGAWAYESLTFGGYWAWDPVENASLVPWLTLIAGLHTLIIFKATKRSLPITLILLTATYLLVWYSTFLTRTGVLGDTSVHAFTGEGKSLYWHLIVVLGVLLSLSIGLIAYRWKTLPRVKGEEALSSREFWMFIGSFVLLLSALQISISTSIPVWSPLAKMITGKEVAPPVDPIQHYNSIQVWVAIIVAGLSASILFLRFKTSDTKIVWRRLGAAALIALVLTVTIAIIQKFNVPQYILLLFASIFAIVANIYYAFGIQKQAKKMGPAISHLGFGLSLLGILLSSFNKEVISFNTLGVTMDFGKETAAENAKESRENVLLFRGMPVAMADYMVTYQGDSLSTTDPRTFYKVYYERRDSATGNVEETFTLYPDAFVNPKGQEGLIANPSSKHYLHKDIFTYVTQVLDPTKKVDTSAYNTYTVKKGDSVFLSMGYLVFNDFEEPSYEQKSGNLSVKANLSVYDLRGKAGEMTPVYSIQNNTYQSFEEDTLKSMGLYARFTKVIPDQNSIELQIKQTDPKDDYIVLKALVFPFINILWLGIIVMVAGFLLSMWNRITKKENRIAIPEKR
ncbi:MAG TPA: cytochrome c biogenesis protein CcsA [Flavipsychrobacter sp.]|nr:cytochrome c biogenesis protein CcsA [Flavipsychrobacter sp.]